MRQELDELSDSLEWKVAGYTQAVNTPITIPSNFKELLVLSTPIMERHAVQTTFVPYMNNINSSQIVEFFEGTLFTSFVVKYIEKTVTLIQINNNNLGGTPYIKVYYR